MITINGNPITVNGNFINNVIEVLPYTLRLKFKDGVTPTFSSGTGVQVSTSPNIWDLTYKNPDWYRLLYKQKNLLEVVTGNTSNVTSMHSMFLDCVSLSSVSLFDTSNVKPMYSMFGGCSSLNTVPLYDTSNVTAMADMFGNCRSLTSVPLFDTSSAVNMRNMFASCHHLTSVPLFDTSNVGEMNNMFISCSSLTSIPLFNTSKVYDMEYAFYDCYNVQSGALALYKQASSQDNPPRTHTSAFRNCGINTQTGSAELAQIPSDWK